MVQGINSIRRHELRSRKGYHPEHGDFLRLKIADLSDTKLSRDLQGIKNPGF
jgi:hypothetical protein